MIKRQYDFHVYLQYRNRTPKSVSANGSDIVKIDIINSVKKYTLKGGPDNPVRYLEMELDRETVIDKYPHIIDNIVEGETRLIIDAVDSGTFIISKIWLDGQTYEITALGSESVIKGTVIAVGYDNIRPSDVAVEVYAIWLYTADWNDDYAPEIHFSRPRDMFESNPITINTSMQSALGLQLCGLADDCFTFFGNKFHPSKIECSYDPSLAMNINDRYFFEMEYTSVIYGTTHTLHINYKVESIDADKHTCILVCLDDNDYGDLSKELRDYFVEEYGDEGRVYLYRNDDSDKEAKDRRKVEYINTTEFAHYNDCMYYVRYSDISPINPDSHYPDRDGEINLYNELDDYNRRYSDFDRLMFEKASEISHQNADASSTVINRQEMLYYDPSATETSNLANMANSNGQYSTSPEGPMSPYYTGGTNSILKYGIHEGAYLINAYFQYNSNNPGMNTVQRICNNMVRRYKDPAQSISFTIKESKMDEFGYVGWERQFEDFSYANKINDDIHQIYLTNAHRCDGVEDKSLLRLSSYVRHYPEMTTTYTFGGTRESGLTQMIADINQRTTY